MGQSSKSHKAFASALPLGNLASALPWQEGTWVAPSFNLGFFNLGFLALSLSIWAPHQICSEQPLRYKEHLNVFTQLD